MPFSDAWSASPASTRRPASVSCTRVWRSTGVSVASNGTAALAIRSIRAKAHVSPRNGRNSRDAPRTNAVPGVAKVVTFLGPTTESMIELKSGETVTVHAPTAAGTGAGVNPGEPVRLAWPPDASLVLDASDRAPTTTLS